MVMVEGPTAWSGLRVQLVRVDGPTSGLSVQLVMVEDPTGQG